MPATNNTETMAKAKNKNTGGENSGKLEANDGNMPLSTYNYKLMLIGFAVIVLGFILMIGGASENPAEEFNYEMFSFRRITLAPILVLGGFAFEVYAIMTKGRRSKKDAHK